jgi:UDP-glucose 4-epimerase
MNKTILLTGGAGYIGSHTAWLLANHGYNVIILDALLHNQPFTHPWATLVKADYADEQALNTIFKQHNIHAVMHFAAFIEVGLSVKNPLGFYENNVSKTVRLLQTMLANNVKNFIFSSSCAVYGIPESTPLQEDHPKRPISPYGKTKFMIEMILEDVQHSDDLRSISLRYFNAAGALPEHKLGEWHEPETHIIPLLLHTAKTKKPFTIFGTEHQTHDGTCVRDYLHVLDIADAHLRALAYLEQGHPSDAFNLGTGRGISVQQLITMVERICDTKLPIIPGPHRPGDPPLLVADPSKAFTCLGWQPQHSHLEHIVQSAWDFEKTKNVF